MNGRKKIFAMVLLLSIISCALSISVGRYPINLTSLFNGDEMAMKIFLTLRLPRTVVAMLGGFALSVAGYVYQTIFKNPLASPDIIGVSSGACVGAAFAIVFLGGGIFATAFSAFAGALGAVTLAMVLASLAKEQRLATFVLSGIAVNALAQALLMLIKLTADPERQLASIEYWTMGSLAGVTLTKSLPTIVIATFGLIGLFLLNRQIVLLGLDSDEARMLGVSVSKIRTFVVVLSTMIVAAIVSVTGLISFIGLIAPHCARLLSKKTDGYTLLLSGLCGSVIMTMADVLARCISAGEVPISILTSLLGAPFLVYLIIKGEKVR